MAKHLDLEEQEQIDQLKHFWNTWGNLISAVVFVIAAGIAGWNAYQYWQTRQATQAAVLLDAIELAIRSGDTSRQEQAFADLRGGHAATQQAAQAGLLVAKTLMDAGKTDAAKDALSWVAEHAKNEGFRALAAVRLAGVLMDQKELDGAWKILKKDFPQEFLGVVSDRRGDVLVLQGKHTDAVAEYRRAYEALDARAEYRKVIEVKLNSLGETVADDAGRAVGQTQ